MKGKIDDATIKLAEQRGINLYTGSLRKTDGRVILSLKNSPFGGCGYVLRSRVVWWLHHDEIINGIQSNIHHINHDRSDDRVINLEKMSHCEHAAHHNIKGLSEVTRICMGCGCKFVINKGRLNEKGRGKYCSQDCYHSQPRSYTHRSAISTGLRAAYERGDR